MSEDALSDEPLRLSGNEDRRARRTRRALLAAWNHLVLSRAKRDIRVRDVVAKAGVGRSTFYDHYSSAEALHLDSLRRPFAPLADAAAGRGDEAALTHVLAHFWDYRQRARQTFGLRTQRLLGQMVEERLESWDGALPAPLAARHLAASAHAAVIAWLAGEAPCTPDTLAAAICRAGRAQAVALAAGDAGG